eukprot:c3495_g1_i1.p1 GENE.c3495_g1_i1~~c3495_g1_i1.p1  ORF type:complete len:125 (+),score=15.57 c3495_g1_i1:27-377(+)
MSNQCLVCEAKSVDSCLPCGHAIMCKTCCEKVLSQAGLCPTCREPFTKYFVHTKFATLDVFEPDRSFNDCKVAKRGLSGTLRSWFRDRPSFNFGEEMFDEMLMNVIESNPKTERSC